ncbi:hypothetical protein WOLCODRAFT_104967 [Wolfiporia cocos MD-104 SS10]|uniref:C3H1-type domain-containing protein n=1 Tax=Wolfiporia cocos (strain MD-104) TaxID=742152 RepID=A0A2H3K2I6_WOLCO|nr:hypothetical protein WOLCODRAFT_104967 [Wolfiporia cocos MD-104 SS10]
MDSSSTSAAALKSEIARLAGVINQHKSNAPVQPLQNRSRHSVYINPNYQPRSRAPRIASGSQLKAPTTNIGVPHKREVIVGGVTFESSGRSLVRKDASSASGTPHAPATQPSFTRNQTGSARTFKGRVSRRGRGQSRNMTLTTSNRPYHSRRLSTKRKYSGRPCPRFTTTGACNRGLTCMYQHDPAKIAVCWNFLQGNCPNTAETCPLSHDPTPERTPLCVHFANNGRCTRSNCPFPHVRVGQRQGICRDFAVLGYCERGLDCDKQHVRECPDFAEKGACTTKGCRLPHVIRAQRSRKILATPHGASTNPTRQEYTALPNTPLHASASVSSDFLGADAHERTPQTVPAEEAQLGDEFISLTFHESDSDEADSDDADEADEADDDETEADNRSCHAQSTYDEDL